MGGRRWQNIIHKQCPDCDTEFVERNNHFKCPTESCGFGLSIQKMAEILTDPSHSAIRFMDKNEENILYNALQSLGIESPEKFMKKTVHHGEQSRGPVLPPLDFKI